MIPKIPNRNNIYGSISNVDSKKDLAELFEAKGWSVRKATFTDFELRINWAEITIEGEEKNPLINGVVDPAMFQNLKQLMRSCNIDFSLELYDDSGTLVETGNS